MCDRPADDAGGVRRWCRIRTRPRSSSPIASTSSILWTPTPQSVPAVLRTGTSELYPEIPDAMLVLAAQNDEHLQMLRSLGLRSAVVAASGAGPYARRDHARLRRVR
ncbi:MAG: hypothetical protein WKH64_08210 [Chloroflexia bacterium]